MKNTCSAVLLFCGFLIGCTPGTHRGYQSAMIGIGGASFLHSGLQTNAALRHDDLVREGDPILGSDPSPAMLVGGVTLNLGIGAAILAMPHGDERESGRSWNGRKIPNWAIDVVATCYAIVGMSLAYNDTVMTRERWYR